MVKETGEKKGEGWEEVKGLKKVSKERERETRSRGKVGCKRKCRVRNEPEREKKR